MKKLWIILATLTFFCSACKKESLSGEQNPTDTVPGSILPPFTHAYWDWDD